MKIQEIIKRAKFTANQWGEKSGKSPGLIRQWAAGIQGPTDENLDALAAGLEAEADELRDLARQLRALKSAT